MIDQVTYFVRIAEFDNSECIRKPILPEHAIHAWCMTEDAVLSVRELYGSRVKIIDHPEGMEAYAIDFHELNGYVIGDHDKMPELQEFDEEKHACEFGRDDYQVVFV